MEILAIVPARGGSKGIPGKNLYPLAGRPLLSYTISHALGSPSVTRLVVSTDDPGIAAVARHAGAEVVPRPAEISGDTASSEAALLHALDYLRDLDGYEPDLVVFLQATSPLRAPGDVERAIRTLRDADADSLFSSCRVEGFVWRMDDDLPHPLSYDHRHRPRRQDAPVDLVENGSIYVFKPWVLRSHGNRLGGRITTYRMGPVESLQIDEPADLVAAERLITVPVHPAIEPGFSRVRLLALDFDGVMTDNRVLVDQGGREAVWCSRADGLGLARLRRAGVPVVVVSTETNPVVAARCQKLSIRCVQGCDDKLAALRSLLHEHRLTAAEVAYVGNDVNDLDCLRVVGLPIAVADAEPEVRAAARFVTSRAGGFGAVREVADRILAGLGVAAVLRATAPAPRTNGARPDLTAACLPEDLASSTLSPPSGAEP